MQFELPKYVKPMLRAFELHPDLFPKGELTHQFVKHDSWCRLLVQGLLCDCNPMIEVVIRGTRYRILKDGEVTAC
jgi:hypothetical protein